MGIDEQTVREIVQRILTVARPDKIILFGSAATGQMTLIGGIAFPANKYGKVIYEAA